MKEKRIMKTTPTSPKEEQHSSSNAPRFTPWPGVGIWNVYFLGKFALALAGYLTLNPAANVALFAAVLFPIKRPWINRVRHLIAAVLGFLLIWSESYLPAFDVIAKNANNLAGFTPAYLRELTVGFINPTMLLWTFVGLVAWYFLRDWIRFSAITLMGLLVLIFPSITSLLPQGTTGDVTAPSQVSVATAEATRGALLPPQTQKADTTGINVWLNQFYASEKKRQANLPEGPIDVAQSGEFDIVLINICSLATDDLVITGLDKAPLFNRFDLYFSNFNSATSYSGPATLRLLTGACGQPSHTDLYEERRPECETMNRLAKAGWENQLYLDHNGKYDDYLNSLRTIAGLEPELQDQHHYHKAMESFDGSPIFSTKDAVDNWMKNHAKGQSRTVSLFNLVTLHDGARDPASQDPIDFKSRCKALLAELGDFMDQIEKSGRKVLFVIVPEHGAALRGDKVQVAKLREIPSPSITHVPVYVKFFGVPNAEKAGFVKGEVKDISVPTSYLALTELVGRVIRSGIYTDNPAGLDGQPATLDTLTADLPQTWPVAENSSAKVVDNYQGKAYLRLKEGKWLEYKK